MTKLPPSSLSSCPNSILIPAGEPPWWRWTPGPMMWGPSSTRCWSPWTPPTGYKYIQPEYSMILDSPDTKKCLQYPWSLYFIGSLTNCFMVTPGANFQDSSTPSTLYCQYFIELFCIRLQISTRKLHKQFDTLSTPHLAGHNGGSWSWPWSSSTSASRAWPTASASTRWIVIND